MIGERRAWSRLPERESVLDDQREQWSISIMTRGRDGSGTPTPTKRAAVTKQLEDEERPGWSNPQNRAEQVRTASWSRSQSPTPVVIDERCAKIAIGDGVKAVTGAPMSLPQCRALAPLSEINPIPARSTATRIASTASAETSRRRFSKSTMVESPKSAAVANSDCVISRRPRRAPTL
jgi:hypothetical protein